MSQSIQKNEVLLSKEFTGRILQLIKEAKESVYIFMFDWRWYKNDFSCDVSLINQALVQAVRRGVSVNALINYAELEQTLNKVGIKARKVQTQKLLHAKSIVLDRHLVVLGSHNLTQNAMLSNVEMSLVVDDSELAERIIKYFESIWQS